MGGLFVIYNYMNINIVFKTIVKDTKRTGGKRYQLLAMQTWYIFFSLYLEMKTEFQRNIKDNKPQFKFLRQNKLCLSKKFKMNRAKLNQILDILIRNKIIQIMYWKKKGGINSTRVKGIIINWTYGNYKQFKQNEKNI